jgi:serine/threonine protein kinase
MLEQGTIVRERYRVARLIGKGGLSYVYEVEDCLLPKCWAMKEFHPRHLGEDEIAQARRQFQSEVKILSDLSHPRLPAVSDSFCFEGKDYLVMELVEGATLDDLLRGRTEPFPEDTVREWALQIIEILEYLHGRTPPVIYRDIKPQNIIIAEGFGVRFIDFGIARLFNPVKEQDTVFMGTPGFAPPEQFRQRQTDFRSDIYSLGATMHFLLTLQDPGNNPFDFEPVSLANPSVSKLMEQVVQRAVEIKAENRFQTAIDMRRVLKGEAALEDLFKQSFIIIEPRELEMRGLDPRRRHSRDLSIRNTSGDDVRVVLTADHSGVGIEPPAFEAPQQTVKVTLDGAQFPRGESVTTAVVVSTEKAKITVPLVVQFKPTFFKGLPPAAAGLILFALPALMGLAWVYTMAAPPPCPPIASSGILVLAAGILGFSVPVRLLGLVPLAFFLILGAFFIPAGEWFVRAASPENGMHPSVVLPSLIFMLVTVSACALNFRLACNLSPGQRSEMKLLVPVSFFVFPALLYFYPHMIIGQSTVSFVLRNNTLFFILGSLTALVYALSFHFTVSRADQAPCDSSKKIHRILTILTLIFLAVGYGALWYFQVFQYEARFARSLFLQDHPILAELFRYTVFLPLTVEALVPMGALICVVSLLALVLFLHRRARPLRILTPVLLGLIFFGVFLSFALSLEEAHGKSIMALLTVLQDSPEKILSELSRGPRGLFDERIRNYHGSLAVAWRQIMMRSYNHALERLQRASMFLRGDEAAALEGKKLRFLMDQVKIWNFLHNPDEITFDYFEGELREIQGGARRGFSTVRLEYFQPLKLTKDMRAVALFLPNAYFCLFTEKGPVRFSCDRDVILSVLFYRAFLDECRGRLVEAGSEFALLDGLLSRETVKTPVMDILLRETSERRAIASFRGKPDEYLRKLARFYRATGRDNLAVPLLLHLTDRFAIPVHEKAELAETLYLLGAAEKADMVVERLKASARTSAEVRYLDAVRFKAKGDDAAARDILVALAHEDAALAKSPVFLRKWRDASIALAMWDEASEVSARLYAADRARMTADDCLRWGWSLDVRGHRAEALPRYKQYRALQEKADPDSRRLAVIRNRIDGGPLPFYIIMEQIQGHRFRNVICGQGIPPESLPELIYYHRAREKPEINLSPNIRLEELRSFTNKNYKKTFNRVVFINPEKDRPMWRFSCSLNFRHPSFYPSEYIRTDMDTLNALYVRCVSSSFSPDEEMYRRGVMRIAGPRHFFAVLSRYRLDPPPGMIELIGKLHNLPHGDGYFEDEVDAGEIFEVFSKP